MTKPTSLADLAPIHAVLDSAYPESLREVAELLYLQLVDDEPSPPKPQRAAQLAQTALNQVERLRAVIGGGQFYWSKGITYQLSHRNRVMCEQFRGDYKTLARKNNLTEQQTRNIVDAWQREQFAKRQNALFGDTPAAKKGR